MTWHTMVLSDADPNHQGFIQRYYATIDIVMSGANWVWQQVDINGQYIGNPSKDLPTEAEAMNDALTSLDGDEWE